jgi:hypothetical protein
MKHPRLVLSKALLLFSSAVVGRPRSARVKVTNRGDAPIELIEPITSDGDLTAWVLGVRRVVPGHWTVLTVTYEPSLAGRLAGAVTLVTADGPGATLVVHGDARSAA